MLPAESRRWPDFHLRPWRDDEWPALHRLHADPDVAHWLGGALTEAQAQAAFASLQRANALRPYSVHALVLPDDSVVGAVGLQDVRPGMPFAGIEATWRVVSGVQRCGFAFRAMNAVLDDARTRLGLTSILTYTSRSNLRSQALMRKLGFRAVPARDFEHPRLPPGHPLRAHVYFEWSAGAADAKS